MQDQLTQSRLKELLDYDPETGVFTQNGVRLGSNKGCNGYVRITIGRKSYRAHRLAFFWMNGAWPKLDVDHINGVRDDNRWRNLREVTRHENCCNIGGAKSNNKSGFLGVSLKKSTGRFQAQIYKAGKYVHLGYHPTAEAAHAAYLKAKDELHPTHQRLRVAA